MLGLIPLDQLQRLQHRPAGWRCCWTWCASSSRRGRPTGRPGSELKASYTNHYQAGLVQILEALELRSNNTVHRPVLEALELIKRYKAEHSPRA